MFLIMNFVVILMMTYRAVAARPPRGIETAKRLRNTELTDSSFSNRHKRAVFVFRIGLNLAKKGMNAMDSLLRDAKPIPSHTAVRQYQKLGSYRQALKDFDSVKPYGVRPFETPAGVYGKVGQVGDRSLVVKSSDGYGNPVMEIIQVKGVTLADGKTRTAGELTDKISYVHKICKSDCNQ